MAKRRVNETFECPHCGRTVAIRAKVCRHCGSDQETGWADETDQWYGDDDFDYDEFVENEFPEQANSFSQRQRRKAWTTFIIVLLISVFVLSIFTL